MSHWFRVGARPTVTVHNFLVKEGVLAGAKMPGENEEESGSCGARRRSGAAGGDFGNLYGSYGIKFIYHYGN